MHPSPTDPGQQTVVNALVHQFKQNLSKNSDTIDGQTVSRPGLVHRLDKGTSGVVMVAKNDQTHKALQENWKQTKKTYAAIVRGKPKPGTIKSPIGRSDKDRKRMACKADGKSAITHFTVIKTENGYSQLEIDIETGRTHQIRVHLSAIGFAIVGDALYGGEDYPRMLLHAHKITFPNVSEAALPPKEVISPLPNEFEAFWDSL